MLLRTLYYCIALSLLAPVGLQATESGPAELTEKDFSSSSISGDSIIFKDPILSGLKKGISANRIKMVKNPVLKDMATAMLDGTYRPEFRIQRYEAYPLLSTTAKKNKTNQYNQFENPTGIYFKKDDIALVFVEKTSPLGLKMRVHGWDEEGGDSSYPLKSGTNVFTIKNPGLSYIEYFTDDLKKAPKVGVHIATGEVNGYFDSSKHKDADWQKILNSTVYDTLDIIGKRVQLAYHVPSLKKYCPEKGLELINLYDKIIGLEYDILGFTKYKDAPKNRMFGRSVPKGFMFADGMGAGFNNDTLKGLADPEAVKKEAWGISHEFGHVNQVRPHLKWVSTTEVTNNIFSAWIQYCFTPHSLRLEHENCPNPGGGNALGGRFNWYLQSALVAKEPWLCHKGPDKMEGYENGGDHFVKLCPLWQLQLYFAVAGKGNKDLYPDLFKQARDNKEENKSNGELQLNFMKNVCDATKQDLTDFFVTAGMLKPIDKDMDDYSRAQLTITEADCKKLINYAKKYKKPASPVIYYISGNSVQAYKNSLPVSGTAEKGISIEGDNIIVDHAEWKNVAAFETYKDKDLIFVVIAGTGSPDNSSSLVPYSQGATRIEAVSWDGKRHLVHGQEGKQNNTTQKK